MSKMLTKILKFMKTKIKDANKFMLIKFAESTLNINKNKEFQILDKDCNWLFFYINEKRELWISEIIYLNLIDIFKTYNIVFKFIKKWIYLYMGIKIKTVLFKDYKYLPQIY